MCQEVSAIISPILLSSSKFRALHQQLHTTGVAHWLDKVGGKRVMLVLSVGTISHYLVPDSELHISPEGITLRCPDEVSSHLRLVPSPANRESGEEAPRED